MSTNEVVRLAVRARRMKVCIVVIAATCGSCFLPVVTGAPEPSTTIGSGHFGFMFNGEVPSINLIAKKDDLSVSPVAGARFTLSYGITDDTDLEAAIELWWLISAVPTGGSIGLRHHFAISDSFDLAAAGRFGAVGASSDDIPGEAIAEYAAVQGIIQRKYGFVRPMLSINLMSFHISHTVNTEPTQKFNGVASSATFGLMLAGRRVQFGPYGTVTNFQSQHFPGGIFVSGGLMFAFHSGSNRP